MTSLFDKYVIASEWRWAHRACGLEPNCPELKRVFALYGSDGRSYHVLKHVADCLRFMRRMFPNERHPHVIMAIIYHDCMYDVGAKDNEERSAEEFDYYAHGVFGDRFVIRVNEMILATKSHKPVTDRAAQIMLDCDLHVLASPKWADYRKYARGVYTEYSVFGFDAYLVGRSRFLKGAAADIEFSSPEMQSSNPLAKRNLATELYCLENDPKEFLGL